MIFNLISTLILTSACQDSVTPLSDLTPKSQVNGWGPVEKNKSNGEQGAADGHVMTIGGKTYTSGLGVHAVSNLKYTLLGKFNTFTSDIGVDDEIKNQSNCPGTVNFKVLLDGKQVYESGKLSKGSAAKPIQINVTGVQELELAVDTAGDGPNCDHADWADAKLVSTSVVPVVNTPSGTSLPVPVPVPQPNPVPVPTPSSSYGADLTIPAGYSSSVCLIGEDDAAPGPKSASLPLSILKNGTYPLRNFSNGCFVAETSGKVILDGAGAPGKVNISNAIVRGIVVRNVMNTGLQLAGAVVVVNSNSKIVDMLVQDNQSLGIAFPANSATALPSNVSMIRTVTERNGYMGFGGGVKNGLFKNSITRFNNRGYANPSWKTNSAAKFTSTTIDPVQKWYISPVWEGGGAKIVWSDNLVVDHMTANDNIGPGLWFDVYNLNVKFTNNEAHHNYGLSKAGSPWIGQGLVTELAAGPVLFDHNWVHDNEGSGIAVMETANVTVTNNKIDGDGLEIRMGCHGPSWPVKNLLISKNTFTGGAKIHNDSGVCGVVLNESLYLQYGIVVKDNTFQ